MARPTPFTRSTSFTNTFAANPTQVFPGASLDVELNNIKTTGQATVANANDNVCNGMTVEMIN